MKAWANGPGTRGRQGRYSAALPAAPLVGLASRTVGVPLQGPLILVWLSGLLLFSRRPLVGAPLAVMLAVTGAWHIGGSTGAELHVWIGALLLPLAVFVGLQLVDEGGLQAGS